MAQLRVGQWPGAREVGEGSQQQPPNVRKRECGIPTHSSPVSPTVGLRWSEQGFTRPVCPWESLSSQGVEGRASWMDTKRTVPHGGLWSLEPGLYPSQAGGSRDISRCEHTHICMPDHCCSQ